MAGGRSQGSERLECWFLPCHGGGFFSRISQLQSRLEYSPFARIAGHRLCVGTLFAKACIRIEINPGSHVFQSSSFSAHFVCFSVVAVCLESVGLGVFSGGFQLQCAETGCKDGRSRLTSELIHVHRRSSFKRRR